MATVDLSQSTISRMTRGVVDPQSSENLRRVFEALGIPASTLVDPEGELAIPAAAATALGKDLRAVCCGLRGRGRGLQGDPNQGAT
jgi:transcriptional regulator with XRE-family HTH domain